MKAPKLLGSQDGDANNSRGQKARISAWEKQDPACRAMFWDEAEIVS
jgi:hypothetical protein